MIRSVEKQVITWVKDLVPERGVWCAAGGRTPSVRPSSNHTHTIARAIVLAVTFTLISGCASDRAIRCNGKLEPINAVAVVPAMNLGAAQSEEISRSASQ